MANDINTVKRVNSDTDGEDVLAEDVSDVLCVNLASLPPTSALQLILDPKYFIFQNSALNHHKGLESLERAARRYCYKLHTARREQLPLIPRRKRGKKVHKPGRHTETKSQPLSKGASL